MRERGGREGEREREICRNHRQVTANEPASLIYICIYMYTYIHTYILILPVLFSAKR
jgi:hypothetical protein